eukprot:gnl/TRDRNA2_/TRDRNA2_74266_c0_seq1.p1 gnl/TRDRNA2_/TRDRNA2_74266_c0~~gnl/TRDRNA2_/TRDRNA2_74266_c0_seq1.p1  ORF type:complete len:1041 (-),score=165.83 gnl/TRDRNA2_/TRDRNA2_74266_c0_seq1:127-3249(-)
MAAPYGKVGQVEGYDLAHFRDGQVSAHEFGWSIVKCLGTRGFCTIKPSLSEEKLDQAVQEAKAVDETRLERPPEVLINGLLGYRGSGRIARLRTRTTTNDGEMLQEIDEQMSQLGALIEPMVPHLGFELKSRSVSYLHESVDPIGDEFDMDEEEGFMWLDWFTTGRVLMLMVLGDDGGILTMQPFDEDAVSFEVPVDPGAIVLLRTDQLSHDWEANSDGCFVMSCIFLEGSGVKDGLSRRGKPTFPMKPVAEELDLYLMSRLQQLKSEPPNLHDIPRRVEQTMNRYFQAATSRQTSVRGVGLMFPVHLTEMSEVQAALVAGADHFQPVPYARWKHDDHYDPSTNLKVCCAHGCFSDDIMMFDGKFFGIAPGEARGMGPEQWHCLQVGYMALFDGGRRKKDLFKSKIGVYCSCVPQEWEDAMMDGIGYGPNTRCAESMTGFGGDNAIMTGRVSYCWGLMGPTIAIDSEAAGAMCSIFQASESLHYTPPVESQSISINPYYMVTPTSWYFMTRMNMMSRYGRSMPFDETADGLCKGEGCGCFYLELPAQVVDGQQVVDTSKKLHGTIVAAHVNSNGRQASLGAPHAPAMQELIRDCLNKAQISALDVDAVDCFGKATLLFDAVEYISTAKCYRGEDTRREAVTLFQSSIRGNWGNSVPACGAYSMIKALIQGQRGVNDPIIHFWKLNPHMDVDIAPNSIVAMEAVEYRVESQFIGFSGFSWGGCGAHVLLFNSLDGNTVDIKGPRGREEINYWPGGGGVLSYELQPDRAYTIVGSWSGYEPEKMEDAGDGVFEYTLTMGENRFEMFQILLDGDEDRVLHPGMFKASQGEPVYGPGSSYEAAGCNWIIDAREQVVQTTTVATEGDAPEVLRLPTEDSGKPGQQYRIYLRINGKYRIVDWEKIKPSEEDEWLTEPSAEAPRVPEGTYYVVGNWTEWQFEEMERDPSTPGKYTYKVTVDESRGMLFQIVRNRDWCQTFFPIQAFANDSGPVVGPDDSPGDVNWAITGRFGEVFEIVFTRVVKEDGEDKKAISWTSLGVDRSYDNL